MSVLRPLLSRRGRLVFVATALLLIGALVAAPSVSGARNAVKQFTAVITPNTAAGGVSGTWTERVKNCGTPVEDPCTASSTIAIGRVRITAPSEFRATITPVSVSASNGSTWTLSYDSGTGALTAQPNNGSNKLNSGEFVDITFSATPNTCRAGSIPFTTTAIGGLPSGPDNQTFSIVGSPPSVTSLGCSFTGPSGQTETISGDFEGQVDVTFGGNLSCSFDPTFGSQWLQFNLPTQVNITPGAGFVAHGPKISTSRFHTEGFDSSLYLICYAVPTAGHTAFATRGGGTAVVQNIGGTDFFVGILPNCYDPITGLTRPEPCVSEQFLDPTTSEIVISVRMQPGDPLKH